MEKIKKIQNKLIKESYFNFSKMYKYLTIAQDNIQMAIADVGTDRIDHAIRADLEQIYERITRCKGYINDKLLNR